MNTSQTYDSTQDLTATDVQRSTNAIVTAETRNWQTPGYLKKLLGGQNMRLAAARKISTMSLQ